jgi:hypothetical protein
VLAISHFLKNIPGTFSVDRGSKIPNPMLTDYFAAGRPRLCKDWVCKEGQVEVKKKKTKTHGTILSGSEVRKKLRSKMSEAASS